MILIVDANVLFSALIKRGITYETIFSDKLRLITPDFVIEEYHKHKDEILSKSGLSGKDLELLFEILKGQIEIISSQDFIDKISEAEEVSPDLNDVHYFALALKFNFSIWSNDKELKKQNKIKVFNTEEILDLIN
ncbi:MAG TPA: PIN domain-containing protein [Candidatus Nanoarchaeia archaeon]|nr:PIN domain-containing protein [Candidatus Nanoarchaeia archaeon]